MAGVRKKSWGKDVNLGPFPEELRKHLLNDDPGPALYLPVILVDLRDPNIAFEQLLPSVELLHKRPFYLYRLALGGYWWLFSVSRNLVHREAQHFCLQENGILRIAVADGRPIVERFVHLLQQIRNPV